MPLAVFLVVESRVRSPLMPLGLFRRRNLAAGAIDSLADAAVASTGSPSREPALADA